MHWYKVDKGGNIVAEHEGEEIRGWKYSEKKLDATKHKYDYGKWVEKPLVISEKPAEIPVDVEHDELMLVNMKHQKQAQFYRLRGELLGYKCNRDNTEQLFALCGVFGDEVQKEAMAWAVAVIELTKDIKRTIEEVKTIEELEEIELPSFEVLRNQVEERYYRSVK